MFRLLKRLKAAEWLQALVSLAFIVAQVWLDLKLPDYMSEITRLTQTPGSAMADIWLAGGKMLLCALGSVASAVIVGFFAARIAASFSQRLRSQLFSKVDSFSMEEINRFSTDSLITRSTNDITQVQMLITMGLQMIIKAPIMVVWAVTKIAGKGLEWSVATGVAVLIMISNWTLQYGASRLAATTAALVMLSEVVFASASNVLIEGTVLSGRLLLGGALVISASVIAAIESKLP